MSCDLFYSAGRLAARLADILGLSPTPMFRDDVQEGEFGISAGDPEAYSPMVELHFANDAQLKVWAELATTKHGVFPVLRVEVVRAGKTVFSAGDDDDDQL
jgi:hypothetical protein